MVILTSFRKGPFFRGKLFSVARNQPEGFTLPELPFLDAVDKDGNPVRLEALANPAEDFKTVMKAAYKARWGEVKAWLDSLRADKDVVLCCWCPYSEPSRAEVEKAGKFICHTGLIGQLVQKHRPDVAVVMDIDREEKLEKGYRPKDLRCQFCGMYEEEKKCLLARYCAGPYEADETGFKSLAYSI